MSNIRLTEEDKQKVVQFLNQIGTHARFDVNTHELIAIFKNLQFMQQVLIPKIDANILEIKQVHQAPEEEQPKKGKKA